MFEQLLVYTCMKYAPKTSLFQAFDRICTNCAVSSILGEDSLSFEGWTLSGTLPRIIPSYFWAYQVILLRGVADKTRMVI